MLKNSFIHIPGIGDSTERRIWESGVSTLDQFIQSAPSFLSPSRREQITRHAGVSLECISGRDSGYFYSHLGSAHQWRMFGEFSSSTAYFDIETTGLGGCGDIITTIALYDGSQVYTYVQGENLDDFPEDILQYRLLVSYNGKTFDVPFIERYFGMTLETPHIDLRYVLHSLGITGGLKSCERQLGIGRTGILAEVDGFFAVLLWKEYMRTGNRDVIETLLSYNVSDAVNLENLMVEAYNRKLAEIPVAVRGIELPVSPIIEFKVHPEVVDSIQKRSIWG